MPANEKLPDPTSGREELRTQLRELEEFVARSSADGDALPAAALEMVARLREIVEALDGLTSDLDPEVRP